MDEAQQLCDRVGIMENGKLIALDTPEKLIDKLIASGFKKKVIVKEANLEDFFEGRGGLLSYSNPQYMVLLRN